MKTGDMVRAGLHMTGLETDLDIEDNRDWLKKTMESIAKEDGDIVGDERFYIIGPNHDDFPPPENNDDILFLVYEAKITGHVITPIRGSFCSELEEKDLERLITILLRVYPSYNPGKPPPSRETCMKWIDENGPDAALDALRDQVGSTVH